MLTLVARHGRMSSGVKADGDLWVDSHHTVEDVGIVLGQALQRGLSDKAGINRYGTALYLWMKPRNGEFRICLDVASWS